MSEHAYVILISTVTPGGFSAIMIAIVVVSSRGRVLFELIVDQEHLNRGGTMHGGLTATLVDETTTMAIMMAEKPPGVTVDMSIT